MKISLLLGMVVAAFGRMACDKGDNGSTPDGTPADLQAGAYGGYPDAGCTYFQGRCTDGESVTSTATTTGTASSVGRSLVLERLFK